MGLSFNAHTHQTSSANQNQFRFSKLKPTVYARFVQIEHQTFCFFLHSQQRSVKQRKILKHILFYNIRQTLPLYMVGDHSKIIATARFSFTRQDVNTAEFLTTAQRFPAAAPTAPLLQFFAPLDKKLKQFLVVLRTSYATLVRLCRILLLHRMSKCQCFFFTFSASGSMYLTSSKFSILLNITEFPSNSITIGSFLLIQCIIASKHISLIQSYVFSSIASVSLLIDSSNIVSPGGSA